MKNGIYVLWHCTLDGGEIGDVANRVAYVKALQISEIGALPMQRHNVPTCRSQLFDQVEADETCRACNKCKHGPILQRSV